MRRLLAGSKAWKERIFAFAGRAGATLERVWDFASLLAILTGALCLLWLVVGLVLVLCGVEKIGGVGTIEAGIRYLRWGFAPLVFGIFAVLGIGAVYVCIVLPISTGRGLWETLLWRGDDQRWRVNPLAISALAATIVCIIGLGSRSSGYYLVLRVVVFGAAVWAGVVAAKGKESFFTICATVVATVFNPIVPFHVLGDAGVLGLLSEDDPADPKSVWVMLDFGACALLWWVARWFHPKNARPVAQRSA